MKADPDVLDKTSKEFLQASKEMSKIVAKLSKSIKNIESSWEDSGQQKFSLYFKEWQKQMGGEIQLLTIISDELKAVANRYSNADKK